MMIGVWQQAGNAGGWHRIAWLWKGAMRLGFVLPMMAAALICAMPRAQAMQAQNQVQNQAQNQAEDEAPLSLSALDEGRTHYLAGDYEAARKAWQPLADAGDPRALYNMSTLYRRGLGVEADSDRATDFLRQSADQGFAEAQYVLASQLFDAETADEADRQQAVRWWLDAARHDHGLSQYRLGLLYWNGDAVARDLVRGRAWMGLASQNGLPEANEARETMDRYLDVSQRREAETLSPELLEPEESQIATGP